MALETIWNLLVPICTSTDNLKVMLPLRRSTLTILFFQARFEVRKAHAKVRSSAKAS